MTVRSCPRNSTEGHCETAKWHLLVPIFVFKILYSGGSDVLKFSNEVAEAETLVRRLYECSLDHLRLIEASFNCPLIIRCGVLRENQLLSFCLYLTADVQCPFFILREVE